jgi:hypothetical protein
MRTSSLFIVLVARDVITAARGVNVFFMLQLRYVPLRLHTPLRRQHEKS